MKYQICQKFKPPYHQLITDLHDLCDTVLPPERLLIHIAESQSPKKSGRSTKRKGIQKHTDEQADEVSFATRIDQGPLTHDDLAFIDLNKCIERILNLQSNAQENSATSRLMGNDMVYI